MRSCNLPFISPLFIVAFGWAIRNQRSSSPQGKGVSEMRRNILADSKSSHITVVCALIILIALNASAQSSQGGAALQPQPELAPQAKPTPTPESRLLRNILRD